MRVNDIVCDDCGNLRYNFGGRWWSITARRNHLEIEEIDGDEYPESGTHLCSTPEVLKAVERWLCERGQR